MRLAAKIAIANSFVMVILIALAVWSIVAVTRLSVAHRTVTVRTAETLRLQVATRDAVTNTHRLEMRNLVFDDSEYAAASKAEAARVAGALERLRDLLQSDEERTRLETAIAQFAEYRAVAARARGLHREGAVPAAEVLLDREGGAVVGNLLQTLDELIDLTQAALDRTQVEATMALGQVGTTLDQLRARAWTAVPLALLTALVGAVAGTAIIAVRMTRSLRRLSAATRAVAEGRFEGPLAIDGRDEIGELARSFDAMAARLREVDDLKERFYATMSHELRSPLMSIREAARLMRRGRAGAVTDKQERLLAMIDGSGDRVLRLVSEVLDLSRANAGQLALDQRWFDVRRAAARAVDELRPQAEERRLQLRLEQPASELQIFGDEERLVQVVVNLVANALRFTPVDGSVTVRVSATDAEAVVEVEDTGVGIRADLLPHVFERFWQAHPGGGGTGLGLALVRAMVEAHDGRVTVESQEGKGSRFTVILPRVPPETPERPREAAVDTEPGCGR